MQLFETTDRSGFLEVLGGAQRSRAASMVLGPGRATGGPTNRHEHSDQGLYVAAGIGTATIESEDHAPRPGTLVLIEAGEAHEIANDGDRPLETVTVYAPPRG